VFNNYSFADTQPPNPNENKKTDRSAQHKAEQPSKNTKKIDPTSKSSPSIKCTIPSATNTTNKPNDNEKLKDRNDTGQEKMERYTFWLSISTGLLFLATIALCVITNLLRKIASQEFHASHRPKIIVHTFENSTDDRNRIGPIFTYVNSGTSDAIIKSISFRIFFSDNLWSDAEMKIKKFKKTKLSHLEEYLPSMLNPKSQRPPPLLRE
jgi:hypothetical protein